MGAAGWADTTPRGTDGVGGKLDLLEIINSIVKVNRRSSNCKHGRGCGLWETLLVDGVELRQKGLVPSPKACHAVSTMRWASMDLQKPEG